MAIIALGLSSLQVGGSLTLVGNTIQFVNDSVAPGANYVYATDGAGAKAWRALSAFGATSVAGTSGQVLVNGGTTAATGAITLSLASALTSINSITAEATTALTLNGGSSGASLVLGQGTNAVSTFTSTGTTGGRLVMVAGTLGRPLSIRAVGSSSGVAYLFENESGAYRGAFNLEGTSRDITLYTASGSAGSETFSERLRVTAANGNLLIGTTSETGLTGAGGLKVASSTASTSTSTGALVVSGGAGFGGAIWGGDNIISTGGSTTGTLGVGTTFAAVHAPSSVPRLTLVRSASTAGARVFDIINGADGTVSMRFVADNASSAATALSITGSSTSITSVTVAATTSSTSTTTGALIVSGGVGIAGAAWIGGNVTIPGDLKGLKLNAGTSDSYWLHFANVSSSFPVRLALASDAVNQRAFQVGYYAGDSSGGAWTSSFTVNGYTGALTLGSASSITAASATNLTLAGGSSGASLVLGQGTNASVTITATGTGRTDFAGQKYAAWLPSGGEATYGTLRIGHFDNGGFISTFAGSNTASDLIRFGTGGAEKMRLTATNGNLLIGGTTDISGSGGLKVFGTTASTSTTSGALQVAGGVGVAGKGYIGGGLDVSGGSIVQTSVNVTALSLTRSGTSNSVNISATNDAGTSYFGRPTSGFFAVGPNADLSSSPYLSINTSGDTTLAGDLTVSGGNIGVGGAVNAAQAIRIITTGLTGADQAGIVSSVTFSSDATSTAIGSYAKVTTAAASFTCVTASTFFAESPGLGAGSAITTLRGLYIANQGTTGITTSVGLDVAAQSGASSISIGIRNAASTQLKGAIASGVTSTATAAGTTTLTANTSTMIQLFTGTTTQTAQLPAANALGSGVSIIYVIKNRSTGIVTVQRAGGDTLETGTTYPLNTNDSVTLVSDGVSHWAVV